MAVIAVCEGSNMSTEPQAVLKLMKADVAYAPGKAANAGGVTVSGFEMIQNKAKVHWSKEEVDSKLKATMENIYGQAVILAKTPEEKKNLVAFRTRPPSSPS
jgi:glutamate dehydrogenase (NADP+)